MVDTDVEEEEQRTFFPLKNTKFLSLGPEFFTPREGWGEIEGGGGGRGTHDGFPHKGDRGILVSPPEFLFLIDGRPGGESGKEKKPCVNSH